MKTKNSAQPKVMEQTMEESTAPGNNPAVPMNDLQATVCQRLKRLGFARSNLVRMYGEEFQLVSDPIPIGAHLVIVDARERRSGNLRRVSIPIAIVHRIRQEALDDRDQI